MATMNISEDDFATLADAANAAARRGDAAAANELDKLARKANASLTNSAGARRRFAGGPSAGGIKWTEVPSCLIDG